MKVVLRGDVDGLVESGAHALFFPHGVGHLLGIQVHDVAGFMENESGELTCDGQTVLRCARDLRQAQEATETSEPTEPKNSTHPSISPPS